MREHDVYRADFADLHIIHLGTDGYALVRIIPHAQGLHESKKIMSEFAFSEYKYLYNALDVAYKEYGIEYT